MHYQENTKRFLQTIDLCLCGECDDISGECTSLPQEPPVLWDTGGAKPSSLTIKWIGSGAAPTTINVRFKNKGKFDSVPKGEGDTYFIEKDSPCKGCNNLFVSNSANEDIASLHISCSNTLYVGLEFGLGSGAGNDNTCVGTDCIFEVVGACVPNPNNIAIEQCTGDQTENPGMEGDDWELSSCAAPGSGVASSQVSLRVCSRVYTLHVHQ